MIKAVIFDFDGTLVNLPIDWDKLKDEIYSKIGTVNLDDISYLDKLARKLLFFIFEKYELAVANKVTLRTVTLNYYKDVIEQDIKTVLVTMNGKRLVEKVLSRLNIAFDLIITREACYGRVMQLYEILKRLSLKRYEVLFIGNRDNDREAAAILGIKYIDVNELGD